MYRRFWLKRWFSEKVAVFGFGWVGSGVKFISRYHEIEFSLIAIQINELETEPSRFN